VFLVDLCSLVASTHVFKTVRVKLYQAMKVLIMQDAATETDLSWLLQKVNIGV
jgi:hypothetical protein